MLNVYFIFIYHIWIIFIIVQQIDQLLCLIAQYEVNVTVCSELEPKEDEETGVF